MSKPETRLEVVRWHKEEWTIHLYIKGAKVADYLMNRNKKCLWSESRTVAQAER